MGAVTCTNPPCMCVHLRRYRPPAASTVWPGRIPVSGAPDTNYQVLGYQTKYLPTFSTYVGTYLHTSLGSSPALHVHILQMPVTPDSALPSHGAPRPRGARPAYISNKPEVTPHQTILQRPVSCTPRTSAVCGGHFALLTRRLAWLSNNTKEVYGYDDIQWQWVFL